MDVSSWLGGGIVGFCKAVKGLTEMRRLECL